MIHIIGDSHSLMFAEIHECLIHHIGPVTMHRIGRDGLNISNFGIHNHDFIVFVFGEIDIRCHIGIQRDRHLRSEEDIINTLTDNFIRSILDCSTGNNQLMICSVVPPTDTFFNPDFPFYGTLQNRVILTNKLNTIMKSKCLLHNIEFLNISKYYALENGELNPSIKDESVHILSKYNDIIEKLLMECIDKLSVRNEQLKPFNTTVHSSTTRKAEFNDMISVHFTCNKEDGTLIYSTLNGPPFKFTIGKKQVLRGFERNVIGMHHGEARKFSIMAHEAYGLRLDSLIFRLEKRLFPADFRAELGRTVQVQDNNRTLQGRVIDISDITITVDANHPLAGSKLIFEAQIVDIL